MPANNKTTPTPVRLAWAVLCQTPNGRSEVIKVTDCDEADRAILENPDLYFKSGPFVLPT
jgi:hypothetical protein